LNSEITNVQKRRASAVSSHFAKAACFIAELLRGWGARPARLKVNA
jgi:hypothetical protein